jgi:hypothetical protein
MSIHFDAVLRCLGTDRAARFLDLCNGDADRAWGLHSFNADLSLAMFKDVGLVEIALRNSMDQALSDVFGERWFARAELFDDATQRNISTAWARNGLSRCATKNQPGKLVASLTFGFWANLLSRGSYSRGEAPFDGKRSYDELLWRPSLHNAFPGSGGSRSEVLSVVTDVRHVRNRIAHHKPVLWGISLPGQLDKSTGRVRRLDVSEAHEATLVLASYLDAQLADWLRAESRVPGLLGEHPEL